MHVEWIDISATRAMIVAVWCLLELCFWYHAYLTKQRLQQQRKPAKLMSRAERQSLYWNCFHTVHEPRKWFAGWFYVADSPHRENPDFSDIHRDNVATWFAWAFWVDSLEIVRSNPVWAAELEWMISNAEHRYGMRFPLGHNPKIRCIRPSLDPVESIHRPFLFYAFNYGLTWLFNIVFLRWWLHFEYHTTSAPDAAWGGIFATLHRWERALWPCSNGIDTTSSTYQHLNFWYRKQGRKATPVVFVHGIGMGLLFYVDLIYRVTKLDRPVFLVEIPYVSMRLVEHVPTPEETASEIDSMLTSQGYNHAIFVAHSFGTAVASWLATFAPKRIGGLVMVDPICFLLNYHHVAFNMLHRVPKQPMEYFIHYFASRELFINHYISRHFQWYRTIFIVYPAGSEDPPKLPCKVEPTSPLSNATVFLSERDIIVDSTAIHTYLVNRGVDSRLMRNLSHGEFLINQEWRQQVLEQIDQLARNIEDEGLHVTHTNKTHAP